MRFRTLLFVSVLPVVFASILAIGGLLVLQVQANTEAQESRILTLLLDSLEKEFAGRMEALANLQFQDNPFYVNRVLSDLGAKFSQGFSQILILDRGGRLLVPVGAAPGLLPGDSPLRRALPPPDTGDTRRFRLSDPVFAVPRGEVLGQVRFLPDWGVYLVCFDDLRQVETPVQVALGSTLGLGGLLLLAIGFGMFRLASRIAAPLQTLSQGVRAFAAGSLDERLDLRAAQEITALGRDFNLMADRIQEFTENLETKVRERTRDLAETRDRMVQMEKLASLGSLVSGFAHELNTPLGNALTALTLAEDLLEAPDPGDLGPVKESLALSRHGLRRAIQMMNRFREVSADQRTAELKSFRLDEFLADQIPPLAAVLSRNQLETRIRCPGDLSVRSRPAALEQIFEELIDNSRIHGYQDGPGVLFIDVERAGGGILLTVGDRGPGIPADLRPRAFDPFVTGQRTEGRTGLGLHIVFNLVTRQLRGTIELLDRTPGTWLQIRFPAEPQVPISSR